MGEPAGAPRLPRKSRRGPKLREASFEDYDQIARLESGYGLTPAQSYEQWTHLWLNNPLYQELQEVWSIGWVLQDENDRIVGSLGSIPRLFELGGRKIVAASSRGWVVERDYRSASLLLLDSLINQPYIDLFVTNTNSIASTPGVTALHCARVPVGLWDEYVFWITHYRKFLQIVLARKNIRLAQTLSYPISAAVYLRDRLTKKSLDPGDVQVKACTAFDQRFDEFWLHMRKLNPHLLLAVRTSDVLEWHYKFSLRSNRVWVGTILDGTRILAYAIFDKQEQSDGLQQMRLVDFQSLDGSTALLSSLLSWALRRCRDEGIHRLMSIGRWMEQGEWLASIAPYRRRVQAWRYFYRASDPELAETLRDRRTWAPSLFDGDAGLLGAW